MQGKGIGLESVVESVGGGCVNCCRVGAGWSLPWTLTFGLLYRFRTLPSFFQK